MALGDPVLNEVALLGDLPAGTHSITNLAGLTFEGAAHRNISVLLEDKGLKLWGGGIAAFPGCVELYGQTEGVDPGAMQVLTPNAALNALLSRLKIAGAADVADITFANALLKGMKLGGGLDANGEDITNFDGIEAITTGTSHIECSFDQVMWIQGASTTRLEIHGGGAGAPAGAFIFHTPNLGGTKTERFRIEGNLDVVDAVWAVVLQKGLKLKDALDANSQKITNLLAPTADGDAVSLGDAVLSGSEAKVVADVNTTGGLPVVFRIDIADGAGDTDVTVDHKVRVIDAWAVKTGAAGAAGDNVTVKNGANAITDAIDIGTPAADKVIARAGEIDDAQHEIAALGTLKVTAAKNTNCACIVYVLAIRVA